VSADAHLLESPPFEIAGGPESFGCPIARCGAWCVLGQGASIERRERLRGYRWSSYRGYAGLEKIKSFFDSEPIHGFTGPSSPILVGAGRLGRIVACWKRFRWVRLKIRSSGEMSVGIGSGRQRRIATKETNHMKAPKSSRERQRPNGHLGAWRAIPSCPFYAGTGHRVRSGEALSESA
jgi:hypothetical protein